MKVPLQASSAKSMALLESCTLPDEAMAGHLQAVWKKDKPFSYHRTSRQAGKGRRGRTGESGLHKWLLPWVLLMSSFDLSSHYKSLTITHSTQHSAHTKTKRKKVFLSMVLHSIFSRLQFILQQ